MMSTFRLFPELPKEMRIEIYKNTFEARFLQLGVDAGVPLHPVLKSLEPSKGPKKELHTCLPSLFAVCKESRDICKSIFVVSGPIFIHPGLETLYISLYAVGRMRTTELVAAYNDAGSSAYPVAEFSKAAMKYGIKDLPEDLVVWKEMLPISGTSQCSNGWRDICFCNIA